MIIYWCLFLIPAFLSLRFGTPKYSRSQFTRRDIQWAIPVVGLTVVIGMRHGVGGDWSNYLPYLEDMKNLDFETAIILGDPGYALLNWMGANFGGGIYFVNSICGLLFSIGLVAFCRQLPRPWLALAVAVPYLVLVVAMGYSRQGVALGIALLAISYLQRSRVRSFIVVLTIAALFHKSAVILIALPLVIKTKNRILMWIIISVTGIVLFVLLLAEAIESLRAGYLDDEYQSAGAGVRIALNALAGIIFLLFKKRFILQENEGRIWTFMSWGTIAFIAILFISPSSTAVDRVALYFLPLQLFVWTHFPDAVSKAGGRNLLSVLSVLGFYALILFVWLFFASHRHAWIPYKFFPFVILDSL